MNLTHDDTYRFVEALLHQQRALQLSDKPASQLRALKRLQTVLSRPLRLGLFGEPGSGKSLLLNILLRQNVFPAGTLGGTRPLTLVRFGTDNTMFSITANGARHRLTSRAMLQATRGEQRLLNEEPQVIYKARNTSLTEQRFEYKSAASGGDKQNAPIEFIEVHIDLPLLQRLEILEIPGNFRDALPNAVARRALKGVDLAIWATSATQAWKKSEFTTWERIKPVSPDKSILVVNHKEALRSAKDEANLIMRLDDETGTSFGHRILVSLKEAFQALSQNDAAKGLETTGILDLEQDLEHVVRLIRNQRLEKAKRILADLNNLAAGVKIDRAVSDPAPHQNLYVRGA